MPLYSALSQSIRTRAERNADRIIISRKNFRKKVFVFFAQCVTEPLFKQNEKYFRSNTARGFLRRMFTCLFVYPRKAGVEGAESICNPVSCYFFLIGFFRFAFEGKLISKDTKMLLSLKIEVLEKFSIHYYSQLWKIGEKLHSKDLFFALKSAIVLLFSLNIRNFKVHGTCFLMEKNFHVLWLIYGRKTIIIRNFILNVWVCFLHKSRGILLCCIR